MGTTTDNSRTLVLDTDYIMGRKVKACDSKTKAVGRVIGVGYDLGVYFLIAPDDGGNIVAAMATSCTLVDG